MARLPACFVTAIWLVAALYDVGVGLALTPLENAIVPCRKNGCKP
jgi:hypothetical protein